MFRPLGVAVRNRYGVVGGIGEANSQSATDQNRLQRLP